MPDGFFGKILWVDLTQGALTEQTLAPSLYRDYLGGYGLGVRLLCQHIPPGADPLGPDNVLGLLPGLLTGIGVPFGGRFMLVARSPLTGGWGEANCGGHFGPALRQTGLDGLFITGAASQPAYVLLDEKAGQIELRDASHLWGLDTVETEHHIRAEVGPGAQVLAIGPAGENRSLIAALITDRGRAAARSGLGAVMGAKRLKAIVARGGQSVPLHDKKTLSSLNKSYRQIFNANDPLLPRLLFRLSRLFIPLMRRLGMKASDGPEQTMIHAYKRYGTCSGTAFCTEVGDAPVKNWRGSGVHDFPLERSGRLSDESVVRHQVKKYHCRYCPVGCGGIVSLKGERYTTEEAHKPEYETLAAFGPLLLNDDLEAITQVNALCDRYGLDTISTGSVIAFAFECAERGLIGPEQAGGLDLSWGQAEAVVELVHQIARRQGLGDLLADGVKRAAERIGQGSEMFAMHAGGQELPMHDPRYEPLVGLAYQVDPTPGRHNTANGGIYDAPGLREALGDLSLPDQYTYQGKGAVFALMNRYLQVVNCVGLCMFSLLLSRPPVRQWINAATGWDLDLPDLMQIGHRIQVARLLFNLRHGIRPQDVSLPARARGEPPLAQGPLKGVHLDMDTMIQDFYQAMGYQARTGLPTPQLLQTLGLADWAEPPKG